MCVVTVSGTAVAADEILGIPIAVPVLCTDVIFGNGADQGLRVGHFNFVGIQTVGFIPSAVRAV
jgi:hypothetical protein